MLSNIPSDLQCQWPERNELLSQKLMVMASGHISHLMLLPVHVLPGNCDIQTKCIYKCNESPQSINI